MKRWFSFLTVLLVFNRGFWTCAVGETASPNGAVSNGSTQSGYEIPEVPMIVHMSEDDMNIFTQNTPANSKSLARSSLLKEKIDLYTQLTGAHLIITHKDEKQLDFSIEIRLKV